MKQKISYILIFISIIVSVIKVSTELNNIGLVLKDISIIFTITLPFILQKLFNFKISKELVLFYVIFVFIAHFLGAVLELYNYIPNFDKLVHTVSGVLTAIIGLVILKKYKIRNMKFTIIFMISFSVCIAGCWEMFEYSANIIFGGDAQRVALTGVNDTMQDIIVAFLGSIITSIYYYCHKKGKMIGN